MTASLERMREALQRVREYNVSGMLANGRTQFAQLESRVADEVQKRKAGRITQYLQNHDFIQMYNNCWHKLERV